MQAKREARRQQLAEKQLQRKASSADVVPAVAKTSPIPMPASTSSTSSVSLSSRPSSGKSVLQVPEDSSEEKDDWDMEADLDLGDLQKQAGPVEEELFKDLEVSYKAPTYVGAGAMMGSHSNGGLSGSTVSIASWTCSSVTVLRRPPSSVFHRKNKTIMMAAFITFAEFWGVTGAICTIGFRE